MDSTSRCMAAGLLSCSHPTREPGVRGSKFHVETCQKDVPGSGKHGAVVDSVTVVKVLHHKIMEDYSALGQICGRDEQR